MQFVFSPEDIKAIATEMVAQMKAAVQAEAAAARAAGNLVPAPIPKPAPAPAPAPAPVPAPVQHQPAPVVAQPAALDAVTYQNIGGRRIDDMVPKDTPGTVYLPRTGHVLSLPQPGPVYGEGEMWAGYGNRVHRQCGAPPGDYTGALIYGGDGQFRSVGGFKADGSNWAECADRFYNPAAYLTEEEKALAALAKQREAEHAPGTWAAMDDAYKARAAERAAQPPPPPPPPAEEDVPIGS